MECGKCKVVVSSEVGYVKCQGCRTRYHHGCSLSSTTWKSKSQTLKDEWRCEDCRKGKQAATDEKVDEDEKSKDSGEPVLSLNIVKSGLVSFFGSTEFNITSSLSSVEQNLKSHVATESKKTTDLVIALCSKIDELFHVIKNIQTSQTNLIQVNHNIREELKLAQEKICTLEVKMQNANGVASPHDKRDKITNSYSTVTAHASSLHPVTTTVSTSRTNVLTSIGRPNVSSSQTSTIAATSTNAAVVSRTGNSTISRTTNGSAIESLPSAITGVRDDPAAATGEEDSWNLVQRRSRTSNRKTGTKAGPKIGTKQTDQNCPKVAMVRPREPGPKKRALFVSRFDPNVTSNEIKQMINASVPLIHLQVSKIQTRRQELYSSFHVEVLLSDIEKIDDVSIWPDGCLIKPYYGRLLPEIVIDNSPDS